MLNPKMQTTENPHKNREPKMIIDNFVQGNKIQLDLPQHHHEQFNKKQVKRSIHTSKQTSLPPNFVPCEWSVICAKGNFARKHSGNVRYRQLIEQVSKMYGEMTSRSQKTALVNQIIDTIRCNGGSFVKKDEKKNGQWYEVDETQVREKVGQSLREKNHSIYKSTTKSKRKLRKDTDQRMIEQIETVVCNNDSIADGLNQLSTSLENHFKQIQEDANSNTLLTSDDVDRQLEIAMTQANIKILESLKNDESIQRMLRQQKDEEMKTAE